MQSLGSLPMHSTFRMPNFTPEEWAENDRMVSQMRAEQEELEIQARIDRAGIPTGYRGLEFTDERVREWADSPSKGLLLQGGVGRGKTHNACAALERVARMGVTAKFTTFDDLLRECRATYQNRDTEDAVISRHANVGILCIDDMGKERVTEWSLPIIFAIINKRGMNGKHTIVTTQYTGQQLVQRMTVGDDSETARAVVSRFMEYDRATIEGKDWRRD